MITRMIVLKNCFFGIYYRSVSIFFKINTKKRRVIALDLTAGKTIKEVAKELHKSFTSISKIIKVSKIKKELQTKEKKIIKMVK
jgi:DNA-binding NarL/FixJ family response regulator